MNRGRQDCQKLRVQAFLGRESDFLAKETQTRITAQQGKFRAIEIESDALRPENGHAFEGVYEQLALVFLDCIHPDVVQVIDGRPEADDAANL